MFKITFIDLHGTARTIEAQAGQSVMSAAVNNMIPGIDGDCGGCSACGTCHVHVDPEWISKAGGKTDLESAMLEITDGADEFSRLACQIVMEASLDGLVVNTPQGQH